MYVLVYVQPNLDFNLAWRIHFNDFLDLFLVLGMTLYILEMTTQKSKVLESVTAQHLILILTLECIWHIYYARDKCGHTNQQRDTEIIKQFWDQVARQ